MMQLGWQVTILFYLKFSFIIKKVFSTGNGKIQTIIFTIFGASAMIVLIEGINMSFVLPAAKCDLSITIAEQGFINSIGYLGIVCSSHFWGFLSDTWGRRKVLQLTFLLTFLFSALSSFSTTSWMLMITRFIVGLRLVHIY